MADSFVLLAALIAVALIFDFLNGLHDAANSIATVVSTRVLSPNVAVAWAAFFNFIAFLFFGLHVAQTIGTGIISPDIVDGQVIFGALMGAIVWNLLTWWGAIPSSSSHALIGGLIGAGAAKAGFSAVVWWGTLKTVAAIVWSPLLGFALALLLWLVLAWLLMRSTPFAVDKKFRVLQLGSAALYSIGHGANDAQKTMGIIASLLFAKGLLGSDFYVPFWVVLSCQIAMALGTLVGGWRIVKTMGSRITQLKPVQGFCAETAGAATLYLATSFGVPVSTTHTITGAIMGVGAARRVSAVRWGIAGSIIIAWVITLPAAALIGALFYKCLTLFTAALTPFKGRLTPQPRHISAGLFYGLRAGLKTRGFLRRRACRDRGPSPNSIQRMNGNATTHIPTTKTKRTPTTVLNMSISANAPTADVSD